MHWHGNATLTRTKLSRNYLFFWTNLTAKMATKELKRMGTLAINIRAARQCLHDKVTRT